MTGIWLPSISQANQGFGSTVCVSKVCIVLLLYCYTGAKKIHWWLGQKNKMEHKGGKKSRIQPPFWFPAAVLNYVVNYVNIASYFD